MSVIVIKYLCFSLALGACFSVIYLVLYAYCHTLGDSFIQCGYDKAYFIVAYAILLIGILIATIIVNKLLITLNLS